MGILSPDKSRVFLHVHHRVNQAIAPMALGAWVTWKTDVNPNLSRTTLGLSSALIGWHSYYGCSSVITDYLRYPTIEPVARVVNLKLHALAFVGIAAALQRSKLN